MTGESTRPLIFTALPAQLEKLKNLNDPRDLDSILTEILSKTRAPTKADYYNFDKDDVTSVMDIFALIWDIIKDLGQLLKASEVSSLLFRSLCFESIVRSMVKTSPHGMLFSTLDLLYMYFHIYSSH